MIGIAPNFVRVGGAAAGIFPASLALSGCLDGNQAAPLIGCDLPKFEGRCRLSGRIAPGPIPALLTRISTRPNLRRVALMIAFAAESSA
jgi:hypothetical protein